MQQGLSPWEPVFYGGLVYKFKIIVGKPDFCLALLCFHARLFVNALRSPAEKGLTSWLSLVMSNCDVVTFPLVSWVRCGA